MEVIVHRAGMATTVQDLGRSGYRRDGVPLSGAMDADALRIANLLVGNPENTAALEFNLLGPELEFTADVLIAVTGGDFGVPRWRPLPITAGTRLAFSAAREGCRGYLAIAGGFDVPRVLGSASTYARAGFGGFGGRVLRVGDRLPVRQANRLLSDHWFIDPRTIPSYGSHITARVVRGAHLDEFSRAFFESVYTVTTRSDRMGLRLEGPALARQQAGEVQSATVVPGTIQVPPDGQPIVLMAEAQTIGGYPQIAHVIRVDLPLVAQLRPGDRLGFTEVSVDKAHELALARERSFGMLRQGLAQKLGLRATND